MPRRDKPRTPARNPVCIIAAALVGVAALASALQAAEHDRTRDVIYGRSYGLALTMDVFRPAVPGNGAGAILVASGGYVSSPDRITPLLIELYADGLLQRGYTVFVVVHGSTPKFTIPEAMADVNRAVRFIRYHAADYGIDPGRLGVYGTSAGGHLALMVGCAPEPAKPDDADPVERAESRVGAVAAFYAPTDYLNYGEAGKPVDLIDGYLRAIRVAFDFHEYDPQSRRRMRITDEQRILGIYRQISPLHQLDGDDPPVLLIHGTADEAVPYQQATILLEALRGAGVAAELITHEGRGHGWHDTRPDIDAIADWFDRHMPPEASDAPG